MSSNILRRSAVLVAAAALVLAGCTDDAAPDATPTTPSAASGATYSTPATACTPVENEAGPLDVITVGGELGTTPTLDFTGDLVVEEDLFQVLCEGDGETIEEGDLAWYLARAEQADGTEMLVSSAVQYLTSDATPVTAGGVAGLTVGTRIVMAFPYDGTPVAQVVELVDRTARDAIVQDVPAGTAGVPAVEAPEDAKPTVTVPEGGVASPAGVLRTVITEGDGKVVEATDTISAHYLGVKGSDGTEFDSSWSREAPSEFSLQGVVSGWTYGLSGLKVGTTVELVIPPAFGYGSSPSHELATETMVFVVTILDVVEADAAE